MSASNHRLYHRLQLAAHRLQKIADRALQKEIGLNTAQTAVLSVLAEANCASQREIARQLGLSEAAVTPMSRRLIGLGLIKRTPCADDARAWTLQLSGAGRERLRRAKAPFKVVNQLLDRELSDAEIRTIVACLNRLIKAMENKSHHPAAEERS
jgi:DNA-binding MarR family transcriptional regulator